MVANDLSRLSMGSVAHVSDDKTEFVKEAHRLDQLGIRLEDSLKGGSTVNHNSEASSMVEVKSQHLDPLLMELKELILSKVNEALYQGGDGVLRYQVQLCLPNMDGLSGLMVPDISFILVQPKCIVISNRFISGIVQSGI